MANLSSLKANISFPERGTALRSGEGGSCLFSTAADLGGSFGKSSKVPISLWLGVV